MHTGRRLIVGLIAVGMGIAALAQPLLPAETDATNEQLPPQLQTSQVTSRYGIVVANTEEAAEAGARILRRGGNAVDAAVATAFALGVAEAEGSGLGGHAWILVRMADGRAVSVSGVAGVPVRADPARMVDLKRRGELVGHRVAVAPAGLAAMEAVRRRFGTMALPSLLEPAIELAITGTRITLHQQAVVETYHQRVLRSRLLTGIFLDADFAVRPSGDRVCQPRLARTLARLAQRGVSDFYRGALARAMIADMQRHGGFLTLADLALVRPSIDEPVRGRFRDYEVLSVPSPGGGGAVVEALQILDRYPPEILMTPGSDHLRIVTEAVRMALYDAYASLGDGGIDDARLADPTLAAVRARQIDEGGVTSVERILSTRAAPLAPRQGGTTHLSVVDGDGNAVSMTLSLNNEFGDGGTHDELGFAYNGALGFYDLDNPRSPLWPRPGRVFPTTAAPTILVRDGRPVIVVGSPGSARITSAVVNAVVNVVDRGMDAAAAVSAPRVLWDHAPQNRVMVEMAGPHTDDDLEALREYGYNVVYAQRYPARPIDHLAFGGVNLIVVDPETGEARGAGDPRRAGAAATGDD
jgi:gamma-glutamyltranspeptidase/glutathione hydrolase